MRSETCQVPSCAIRLTNDDQADPFTGAQVERLGRTEDAVLVERFKGSH